MKTIVHILFLFVISISPIISKSISESLLEAQEKQTNIFISYGSDWCLPCQLMKENVFPDKEISSMLANKYVYVNADIDEINDNEWFDNYHVTCLPTLQILDSKGKELGRWENGLGLSKMKTILKAFEKTTSPSSAYSHTSKVESNSTLVHSENSGDNMDASKKTTSIGKLVNRIDKIDSSSDMSFDTTVFNDAEPLIRGYKIVELQVGAFGEKGNADKRLRALSSIDITNVSILKVNNLYKVIVSFYDEKSEKNGLLNLKSKGIDYFHI